MKSRKELRLCYVPFFQEFGGRKNFYEFMCSSAKWESSLTVTQIHSLNDNTVKVRSLKINMALSLIL